MHITGARRIARGITQGKGALVVMVLVGSCAREAPAPPAGGGPRATPAPGWTLESAPRESLLAYGGRLEFDTSHAASDAQNLILPATTRHGSPGVGPYASVAPEIGTAALTRSDLGAGRIIARIVSRGSYSPLRLDSGTTYVWVDSLGAMAAWRMVLISSHATTGLVWKSLVRHTSTARMTAYMLPNCSWTQPAESFAQPCCYCEAWGWCTGDTTLSWSTMSLK